jgi:hypothetical protein
MGKIYMVNFFPEREELGIRILDFRLERQRKKKKGEQQF